MATRDKPWLEDFSYIFDAQSMRHERGQPEYEVFAGSKPLAWLWLALLSAVGGALGGTMVSGAFWGSLLLVPLWLVVTVAVFWGTRRLAIAVSGSALGFLTGWCLFWSLLIGAVAMWGAQLSGAGWAYGVAGVFGFLVGIIQGVREPDDVDNFDIFFMIGTLTGPIGACLAAWVHRNLLPEPFSLVAAAVTGAIAGFIFLAPVMAYQFARLNNVGGLKRLASLFLHRDETAAEALPVLDTAIRIAPEDASLFDRRGLAHALAGNAEAAEQDWTTHVRIAPKSAAPDVSRGWVALRRGRSSEAAAAFEAALGKSKRDRSTLIGLGVARLRLGDGQAALDALNKIPGAKHDALSMTYLAEAHLAVGDAKAAVRAATDAIDELDSIFSRTWLVRAEAKRKLGRIGGAAKDYNKAWHFAEEEGIQDRALDGLDTIERPLDEDPPE